MRASPQAGIQPPAAAIFEISPRAAAREPALSRATNHWSTALKMIGVLERQQCG
jgi:hypothetical protein